MIFDNIINISRYSLPNGSIELINNYLLDFKEHNFILGKFSILNDKVFGIGLEYETKERSLCPWEAHEKYLDIHYLILGKEIIDISDEIFMKETKDYDLNKDYALFSGNSKNNITISHGEFMVIFPNEVHRTGVHVDTINFVKKIVFKVLL